jgi:hypothetical protein
LVYYVSTLGCEKDYYCKEQGDEGERSYVGYEVAFVAFRTEDVEED